MSRVRKSATVAAMAVPLVGGFEGLRQNAYPDPATRGNPLTICYGHTGNVKPGERRTLEECKAILLADLDKEGDGIERCLKVELTDGQYVAVLSLAHNLGVGGTCKSSVVRLFNDHKPRYACNFLLKFDRAAGIRMPGLTARREKERALCLADTP